MSQATQARVRALLFLMAAAMTAAASQPGGGGLEQTVWAGVKLLHFTFGAIGAAVMVTTKPLPWFELIATLVCGVVVASVGTPLVVPYLFDHPSITHENAIATVLGASGLYLVVALRKLLSGFARDPAGVLRAAWARWRGAGAAIPDDRPRRRA